MKSWATAQPQTLSVARVGPCLAIVFSSFTIPGACVRVSLISSSSTQTEGFSGQFNIPRMIHLKWDFFLYADFILETVFDHIKYWGPSFDMPILKIKSIYFLFRKTKYFFLKRKFSSRGFPGGSVDKNGACQRSLIQECSTCHRTTKPLCKNYLSQCPPDPMLPHQRSRHNEKPKHHN